VEFNRNSNFISNDILLDFVARSKNHGNYSLYQMNFIRDEIVDKLIKIDIKYYLFNDVIMIVKSTIFKLKIINVNIYFL